MMAISWVEIVILAVLIVIVMTLVISGAIASRRWGLLFALALLAGAGCGVVLFGIFALRVEMRRNVASRTTQAVTSSPVDITPPLTRAGSPGHATRAGSPGHATQAVTSSLVGEAVTGPIATPVAVEAVAEEAETAVADETDEPAIVLEDDAGRAAKAERPAWVEQGRVQVGDVVQVSLASGPEEKLAECRAALDRLLQREVAAFIDTYFGPDVAGTCRPSEIVRYDLNYLKSQLIKPGKTFEEKLQLSFGPMYQTHALLEFGPEFRRALEERRGELERYAREVTIAHRLRGLVVAFGAAFGALALGFVWFRRAARPGVS